MVLATIARVLFELPSKCRRRHRPRRAIGACRLPLDAQAVLLIEIDGMHEEIATQTAQIEHICAHFEGNAQIASSSRRRATQKTLGGA
jgi:hypothetical protein